MRGALAHKLREDQLVIIRNVSKESKRNSIYRSSKREDVHMPTKKKEFESYVLYQKPTETPDSGLLSTQLNASI